MMQVFLIFFRLLSQSYPQEFWLIVIWCPADPYSNQILKEHREYRRDNDHHVLNHDESALHRASIDDGQDWMDGPRKS